MPDAPPCRGGQNSLETLDLAAVQAAKTREQQMPQVQDILADETRLMAFLASFRGDNRLTTPRMLVGIIDTVLDDAETLARENAALVARLEQQGADLQALGKYVKALIRDKSIDCTCTECVNVDRILTDLTLSHTKEPEHA